MIVTSNQMHFTSICSEIYRSIPPAPSLDFYKGFHFFVDYFYVGCLSQDHENTLEDGSSFIELKRVLEYIQIEMEKNPLVEEILGDPKEFWIGFLRAQEVAQNIFLLAQSSKDEAA